MKHPSEWTETEKERFRKRHEAMVKELKSKEFYCEVAKRKFAEQIVEKYKDVKWLDKAR